MSTYQYPQPLPTRRNGSKASRIQGALLEELAGGGATTVRFLFYRLESRGVVDKDKASDAQAVSSVLTELRDAGVVPMEQIIDRTRSATTWPTYATMDDAVRHAVASARIDPWNGRPRPQLWVESESLAGWIEPTAYRYAVRVVPLKGQSSRGLVWEAAEDLTEDTTILYLGDCDRSGRDIERAFIERVSVVARMRAHLATRDGIDSTDVAAALVAEDMVVRPMDLNVRRVAVTEQQVIDHDLPVIYKRDKRDGKTAEATEAEALPEAVMVGLIEDALMGEGVDLAAARHQTDVQRRAWQDRLDEGSS